MCLFQVLFEEHDRKEYFHEYYVSNRDLSQKRSAAVSKLAYKDPEQSRTESAA